MTASPLALDHMMTRLTEADRAAMRSRAPVNVVDQLDAATADVDKLFADMGRNTGAVMGTAEYPDVPQWLRLSLVATWFGFIDGTIDTCQHAPNVAHPQPVMAAVWHPGLVVCAHCIHLTRARGLADLTCDRCGRVCEGLDQGEGIHPCATTFGPLVLFYGLCPGCMSEHTEATS